MKWLIIPAFWFLYWGICFLCTGMDKKNLTGLRSYPDAVQNIVRERLAGAPNSAVCRHCCSERVCNYTDMKEGVIYVIPNYGK